MNIIPKAIMRPHHCAVYPHLGSAQREGYFDTGTDLPGPGIHENRIYVSVVAVKELARKLGWITPEEHANQRAHIEALSREVERLQERLDATETVIDAIDVIESAEFRARKRSGARKKTPA